VTLSVSLIILLFTSLVSITSFGNQKIYQELIFYPPAITKQGQWYRFFTCGLLHADWEHLLFNMLSLYLFGGMVETYYKSDFLFGEMGKLFYAILYVLALLFSLIPTFIRHKNDYSYRSLGASGAVSAIVFAGILFNPTAKLGFFFIPPVIPGYIFGPLYLLFSTWLERKGKDNINHSAHIWGALFGLAFTILLCASLNTSYQPIEQLIKKISAQY
jgi:membrane associated rhomboid family serine protease